MSVLEAIPVAVGLLCLAFLVVVVPPFLILLSAKRGRELLGWAICPQIMMCTTLVEQANAMNAERRGKTEAENVR